MATLGLTISLSLVQTGCSKENDLPTIVADRTACSNCKMLVSDVVYATAFRVDDEDQVFDDLGCMLDKLEGDPSLKPSKTWVHDQTSSEWIEASGAHYVYSKAIKTPMGFGYASFRSLQDAEKQAAAVQGDMLNGFDAVRSHYNKK